MTVKELKAKVKMLEKRITELEGVKKDDNKDWLWDADKAGEAAFALQHAFNWAECPYKSEKFWYDVHDTLMQISREGNE